MGWGEAWRLTHELLADPSSHVAAAAAGWQTPWSREALILADLFDLFAVVNARPRGPRPKPYPRPSDRPRKVARPTRSQREIRAALAARGH